MDLLQRNLVEEEGVVVAVDSGGDDEDNETLHLPWPEDSRGCDLHLFLRENRPRKTLKEKLLRCRVAQRRQNDAESKELSVDYPEKTLMACSSLKID